MRRPQRLIALAVLIALSGALAGCGGGGLSSFDPSDLLDFLDTKKKLPGERKPVFPEGVPGLEQGVPKNLYKGSRQEQIDQQNAEAAAAAAAAPPPQEPKSKRGAKAKPPATAARAPDAAQQAPDADAAPEEEGSTAAAPPAPKPKIVRRRTTAPPPDAPAQPAAQQPPQQSAAPFPAPMPSGTFTR
jgi:predicted small lipoprotein YifL